MRAADMMREAREGQQAQEKTPLDNLFRAFKRIAEVTLYYLSEYTDEATDFTFKTEGDRFDTQKFIGEKYKIKDPTAVVIPHSIARMEVEIEDVSTASMNAKRDKILELAKEFNQLPQPFQKVLLDLYKVGSTSDILDDFAKSQTLLDSPEFQSLIAQAQAGNVPPEVKTALAKLLRFLSEQAPVKTPEEMNAPQLPAGKMGGANAPQS